MIANLAAEGVDEGHSVNDDAGVLSDYDAFLRLSNDQVISKIVSILGPEDVVEAGKMSVRKSLKKPRTETVDL